MTEAAHIGDIVGTIRRRLLVNSWADPEEVAPLLPDGIRPHIGTTGGVVVGCCMIEIDASRPWPMPGRVGVGIRAAAHRISVEIGSVDSPTLAVYVPARSTDSRMAIIAGGRAFPGVHQRSAVSVSGGAEKLSWSIVNDIGGANGFDIAASASLEDATEARSEVADIVIGTTLGLSPGRRSGRMEAAHMILENRQARTVELTNLESHFLDSFATGVAADSLLMTDVGVIWRADRAVAAGLGSG